MKTRSSSAVLPGAFGQLRSAAPAPISRVSYLHLVTAQEIEDLRQALAIGQLPVDLEAKLTRLAEGDLLHCFVARHCRCFVALLLATQDGSFREASQAECDWLLRLLAYVRRDEDAIADYRPAGFVDDQQEVRAATVELAPLLRSFKAWRLRHQVPGMWWTARSN